MQAQSAHNCRAAGAAAARAVLAELDYVTTKLNNGGLFSPNHMWAAVVDSDGVLCAVAKTQSDGDANVWPGSRSIAIAKADTANDFSNNLLALSVEQ